MEESNKLEQQPSIEPAKKIETIEKVIDTSASVTPVHLTDSGHVEFDNKLFSQDALKELRPDLFSAKADVGYQSSTNFGTSFPKMAKKGDIFVRVDVMPNRVFKFDGQKWIEINKEKTDTYLFDQDYIRYLVEQLDKGQYDPELLSDAEQDQIRQYLNGNQNS